MKILPAFLVLSSSITAVSAQGIEGGNVSVNTYNWDYYAGNFLSGSVVTHFGQIGLQFDASIFAYTSDGAGEIQPSIGVHAFYEVSPGLNLGAVAVFEEWSARDDSDYAVLGLEAAFDSELAPFSLDIFVGHEVATEYDYRINVLALSGVYDLTDNFALTGSLRNLSDYYDFSMASVGSRYRFENGFEVAVEYTQTSDNEQGFGLMLSRSFGSAVPFLPRSFEHFARGW